MNSLLLWSCFHKVGYQQLGRWVGPGGQLGEVSQHEILAVGESLVPTDLNKISNSECTMQLCSYSSSNFFTAKLYGGQLLWTDFLPQKILSWSVDMRNRKYRYHKLVCGANQGRKGSASSDGPNVVLSFATKTDWNTPTSPPVIVGGTTYSCCWFTYDQHQHAISKLFKKQSLFRLESSMEIHPKLRTNNWLRTERNACKPVSPIALLMKRTPRQD